MIFIITNIIVLIVSILASISTYFAWKGNKSNLDRAIFLVMATFTLNLITSISYYYLNFSVLELFLINLSPLDFWKIIVTTLYIWFFFYALGWKRFYGIPYILGFFIIYHCIANGRGADIIFYIFLAISLLVTGITLTYKSIKNKNGLLFALGVFGIMILVNFPFLEIWYISLVLRFFQFGIIILGENGWLDEKIFYDREKKKQIQNTWLASRIK